MTYYLYRKGYRTPIDSAESLREARRYAIVNMRSKSDSIDIKEDLWDSSKISRNSKIQSYFVYFSLQYGMYVFARLTPTHADVYECMEDGRLGKFLFSRDYA